MKVKAKIRAYRDFVWCTPAEEVMIGGIIVPDTAKDEEHPLELTVVAVGDGLVEGGKVVELVTKVGDRIRVPKHAGTIVEIRQTNEKFFVLRENQIFGAVTFE